MGNKEIADKTESKLTETTRALTFPNVTGTLEEMKAKS